MPLAHIHVGQGRASQKQKTEIIARMTAVFAEVLGSDPNKVWIVVHDVPRTQWGINGAPLENPEDNGSVR
jgi:4-oxalocrotonate tautomerase